MTGTIFEQGQTFADEIDYKRDEPEEDNDFVEVDSDFLEDEKKTKGFEDLPPSCEFTKEEEEIIEKYAVGELNPDLSTPSLLEDMKPEISPARVVSLLTKGIFHATEDLKVVMASVAVLGEAVEELQTRLNALVKKLDIATEEEDGETFYEPDDEEEIVIPAKKSGMPGRPVKQAPKLKVAKKKKAKALIKKAVQRKPKSVKKKTKR